MERARVKVSQRKWTGQGTCGRKWERRLDRVTASLQHQRVCEETAEGSAAERRQIRGGQACEAVSLVLGVNSGAVGVEEVYGPRSNKTRFAF